MNDTRLIETGACPECGCDQARFWTEEYADCGMCPQCGNEWEDSWAEVYGPMSVPWGFLL